MMPSYHSDPPGRREPDPIAQPPLGAFMRTFTLPRLSALLVALVFAATTVRSAQALPHAPNRAAVPAALRALTAPEKDAEAFAPVATEDGISKQYGLDSQILRRYWLRTPQAYARSAMAPRQVAESFLSQHATELGLKEGTPLADLAFGYEKGTPSGAHLRFDQTVDGVPVYRAEVVVKVNKYGQVSSVQNNLQPDLKVATKPTLDETQALAIAKGVVNPTGRMLMDPRATLNVVVSRTGPRLAWLVQMPVEAPMGDWLVFVDANDGQVFGAEDRMVYAEGTGRVFDPDPMTKMNDSTYLDNNDADTAVPFPAAYDIVPLHGITLTGSTYSLSGPYVQLIDNEAPTVAPVTAAHPDSFRFQRSASGFEDVMVYHHLDFSQRYIQSLGFTNINNRVQGVDSHGLSGADNSHYVPSTGNLAFGEGGVDDDEDADVIWHEYGHSIQDNIVPGWGGGQEGQMGEGWGDYWAGSYSISKNPTFQINRVFTWDGNGETWTGRPLINTALHYPADCCGEVHASGTLWCSATTDCLHRLGRAVMDVIMLDHHFALGTTATMADAANQVIQSDIDLFGGAHVSTLVERFAFWGMVDPAAFVPAITHTPLTGGENVTGPYAVTATVTSTKPLAAGSPTLFYGFGAAITDSVAMTPTGIANQYTANIPGPGVATDVRYYLRAVDNSGGLARLPSTAPATPYLFHVGPNLTPPTIVHTPITSAPLLSWPRSVSATVTDDIGVNPTSVKLLWTFNGVAQSPITLARVGTSNVYSGAFASLAANVGDVVTYHLEAADLATVPNAGRLPATGEYSFTLIASLGAVLVLDDDELVKAETIKRIVDEKDPSIVTTEVAPAMVEKAMSSNKIAGWLNGLGYVATVEPAASSDPTTWSSYAFLVSASGSNTAPVANAAYRTALESYVAAGGKLIVEGGEVGYDAISTPGYPTFAANVLHCTTWAADNAGSLTRLLATHPVATTPNALPATIALTYVNFGDEDAYTAVSPSVAIYGGSGTYASNATITAFDNNSAPQAGQIVVFAFNMKALADSTLAPRMLQNAAAYLLAPEPSPLSTITGRVSLGTGWSGAGTTITLTPSGRTTTTDVHGEFSIGTLYPGSYSVAASASGYAGTPRIVTVGPSASSSVLLALYPISESNLCRNPARAIPDNNTTGIRDTIVVAPSFAISSVEVSVNITHTYKGDLIVDLIHSGTSIRLHNRTGGSADNIIGTYPTTITPNVSLAGFNGAASNGQWFLNVSDRATTDTGTLNQWCLVLRGASDTTRTVGVGDAPHPLAFGFAPAWPNPSRGGHVSLEFSLPHAAAAQVALYDVGGRRVRLVADRTFAAGRYTLVLDGRDDQGQPLQPGVYMARLTSGGQSQSQRVFVLQ